MSNIVSYNFTDDNSSFNWLMNISLNAFANISTFNEETGYKYGTTGLVFVITILGIIIILTIIGNVFVVAAIMLEKSLQVVTNYLIASLAVTDLMVATLVMPIGVLNQVSTRWFLASEICEVWISFDVLLCTASILHLVAISLDRFRAVANIDYIRNRNAPKLLSMVAVVWVVSICISIPPLFGWRDEKNNADLTGMCLISQDRGYRIFSTVGAFYCPLVLMLFLNFKIFIAARSHIRKKKFRGRNQQVAQSRTVPATLVTKADGRETPPNSSGSDSGVDGYSSVNGSCYNMDEISCSGSAYDFSEVASVNIQDDTKIVENNGVAVPVGSNNLTSLAPALNNLTPTRSVLSPPTLDIPGRKRSVSRSPSGSPMSPRRQSHTPLTPRKTAGSTPQRTRKNKANNERRLKKLEKERHKRDKIEMRRERKAARVLLIITGAFVLCWLPFFLLEIINPFCGKRCKIPDAVYSFFVWLGYFNSLVNPAIYTIFNPSFRTAFKKILFGKYRRDNFKLPR